MGLYRHHQVGQTRQEHDRPHLDHLQTGGKESRSSVLSMGLDTTTATGKLMLNIMGSVAEFERSIMLERQKEGIAKAKAAGKYRGRVPTARRRAKDIIRLRLEGAKFRDRHHPGHQQGVSVQSTLDGKSGGV